MTVPQGDRDRSTVPEPTFLSIESDLPRPGKGRTCRCPMFTTFV